MDLGRGTRGGARWLLVILVVAITFGTAAALLAGPAAPFTPSAPNAGPPLSFQTFGLVFGWTVVGLCVLWVVNHFRQRSQEGSLAIPNRIVVSFLVAVLIAIAFIVIVRSGILGTSPFFSTVPAGGTNSSSGPTPAGQNNSTLPPLGSVPFGGFDLPGWVLYAGILGAAVIAVVVAVPVLASLRDRASTPSSVSASKVARRDFSEAIDALADPGVVNPRAVIIALYARLLGRIEPTLAHLDAMAPREIELECVHRLRIRPTTARELTGLFEEARYSSHALSLQTVERARAVFAHAVDDLDHPPGLL